MVAAYPTPKTVENCICCGKAAMIVPWNAAFKQFSGECKPTPETHAFRLNYILYKSRKT